MTFMAMTREKPLGGAFHPSPPAEIGLIKTKKILDHIKLTKHRLRKLFLFLRHRESEYLWLLNSLKSGQKFVYKNFYHYKKLNKEPEK